MSCIIVMGFYRTASSAVAGVLHQLGVFMGSKFDPPNENNTQGYWEDLEFKNLHKSMMVSHDVSEQYEDLIRFREKNPIWGVKDPLLCLLLPNLVNHLQSFKIIHTTRNVQQIKNSMLKGSPDLTENQFLSIYQIYDRYIQRWLTDYHEHVMSIDYSEMADPVAFIKKIAEFVELPINDRALQFIVPKPSP